MTNISSINNSSNLMFNNYICGTSALSRVCLSCNVLWFPDDYNVDQNTSISYTIVGVNGSLTVSGQLGLSGSTLHVNSSVDMEGNSTLDLGNTQVVVNNTLTVNSGGVSGKGSSIFGK
jgi:hypothetical protein